MNETTKTPSATAAELLAQAETAAAEAQAASHKAEALRRQASKAALDERLAKERAENAAHYTRMYAEIGQPLAGLNEAQHGIVYSEAWTRGHAYGFSDVESHYSSLADMARKLLAAN